MSNEKMASCEHLKTGVIHVAVPISSSYAVKRIHHEKTFSE